MNNTVSTHWATIHNGKLQGVCKGFPAQELGENQFPLTTREFDLLRMALLHKYTLNEMKTILRSVSRKIKEIK